MPCFKGIAVSIHANSAPLPEYGMQKQSRLSRISTYIPVPQPQLTGGTNKPEPAKFAISITLLTPGLAIPYSAPKSSETNPFPKPQFVGNMGPNPSQGTERGKYQGIVSPYIPMTNSENETIAAYIYFDGRAKEEVATLLRPGEETWVNSRWVQVPESEGGGLAEREFLFREVGLERWLNGLDLQGHDVAGKLEKRRQKFERRQKRQQALLDGRPDESGNNERKETLRYSTDDKTPLEVVDDDSDSWSDDDDEPPEATGQIKVAMFRVLASGEIKKGEYSPQFDAHDGDEEDSANKDNGNINADVEHTTSFAKPKTLDPKTISTQTVTGIDAPDKPYAVFTFFYRGDKQLQKIGVMQSSKSNNQTTPGSAKRRSGQLDFSNLGPLKSGGTVGFSAFRDKDSEAARKSKARKKSNGALADDSDDDDDDDEGGLKMDDADDKIDSKNLKPEDAQSSGELVDGVNRIHLKRAHSADPDSNATGDSSQQSTWGGENSATRDSSSGTPATASKPVGQGAIDLPAEGLVGSPLKKQRPSIDHSGLGDRFTATQSMSSALESVISGTNNTPSSSNPTANSTTPPTETKPKVEEDEEL